MYKGQHCTVQQNITKQKKNKNNKEKQTHLR